MKVLISPIVTLLLINLTMSSILLSTLLFTLNTYIANTQITADNNQKQGYHIINQIFSKLDSLSSKSQSLIKAQGNISDAQRHKIIQEFENLPTSGIASHADINNLIGNITHQYPRTANITLQKDNNKVIHEILNLLKNGTRK